MINPDEIKQFHTMLKEAVEKINSEPHDDQGNAVIANLARDSAPLLEKIIIGMESNPITGMLLK